MPDLPNRTDLFNVFADEVTARANARSTGRQLTSQEIFTEGSDINLIGAGASAMGEEVMRQTARGLQALTLDGAVGVELDRYVQDTFDESVVRKAASPALVPLTLARPTAAFGAFTYPAGSRLQTKGGILFTTLTAGAFGASSLTATVEAQAVDAGIAGNVAENTITQFVTQPLDATLTVTNAVFAAGGDTTENDASLRARARLFWASVRRGTLPAIVFGALTVPGVRSATAEEEEVSGVLTGRVFLYVADANGQANSSLVEAVRLGIYDYRAAGGAVDIIGAVPVFIPITLALAFDANVDTVAAFDRAARVIVGRVNQTQPNRTLLRSTISAAAGTVPGVRVTDSSIVAPAGDVVPATGQIVRTRRDLVTVAP